MQEDLKIKYGSLTGIGFCLNPKTGEIEAWKDGKQVGEILTMGNLLDETDRNEDDFCEPEGVE